MSGITTGTALMIGGGISAATGIGGALIGSSASNNAANTQANAADYAANLQYQAQQQALGLQQQEFNTGQQNLAPWLQQGQSALANLSYLMGIPFNQGSSTATGANNPLTGNPSANVSGAATGGNPSGFTGGDPQAKNLLSDANVADATTSTAGAPTTSAALGTGATTAAGTPSTGGTNLAGLVNPNLGGYGSLLAPYSGTFIAPTGLTMQNDPGYQARLQLGSDAMERSAAARGGLLTGGTAQELNQNAQNFASNEYGNVYNRALNTFGTNYNVFENNQANTYNRLAALSGLGQTTAAQLGQLGTNYGQNASNTLMSGAAMQGQAYQNAAAARASGYIGGANAWGGALSGLGGNISNLLLMQQLMNGFNPGSSAPTSDVWTGAN